MAYRAGDKENRIYLDRDDNGSLNNAKNSNTKKSINNKSNKNRAKKTDKVASSTENSKKAKRTELKDYDSEMQEKIIQEMHLMEKKRRFLLTLFSLIGFLCIGYILFYYFTASKSEKRWNDLANMVGSTALSTSEKTTVTAKLNNNESKELTILRKYETLYNSNKKLIGWLKIADTIIDYPVMQCDNNTYYLNHNFDQEEDKVGTLFLDCECDVVNGCDNFIIYGHHLQSGKMFSSLEKYESEKYYKTHQYITFDTIYEEQTFEVMYVFRSRVYNDDDIVFKYYQFINANSEEEFLSHMNEMKAMSFYDTGVNAYYGDQLLTLSTCDYNETNGRFVVVAKRIK